MTNVVLIDPGLVRGLDREPGREKGRGWWDPGLVRASGREPGWGWPDRARGQGVSRSVGGRVVAAGRAGRAGQETSQESGGSRAGQPAWPGVGQATCQAGSRAGDQPGREGSGEFGTGLGMVREFLVPAGEYTRILDK